MKSPLSPVRLLPFVCAYALIASQPAMARQRGETKYFEDTKPKIIKKSVAPKQQAKTIAQKFTPVPQAQPEKPGFLSRLWPFGGENAPQAPQPSPQQASQKVAKPTPKKVSAVDAVVMKEAAKVSVDQNKPGFFGKLFSFGDKSPSKPTGGATPNFKPIEKPFELVKPPVTKTAAAAQSNGLNWTPITDASGKLLRPDDWETKAFVTEDAVEAYLYGPAQAYPDARLNKGTMVSMKSSGKNWSDVVLEDGRTMTVPSDQIRKAAKDDFRDPPPPIVFTNPAMPAFQEAPLPEVELPQQEEGLLPASNEGLVLPGKN